MSDYLIVEARGLTFMDLPALRELIRQNEYARSNRHNLAVVRGTAPIQRLLALTGVEDQLVLVDEPGRSSPHHCGPSRRDGWSMKARSRPSRKASGRSGGSWPARSNRWTSAPTGSPTSHSSSAKRSPTPPCTPTSA